MLQFGHTEAHGELLRRRQLEIERRLAPFFALLAACGLVALAIAPLILPARTVLLAAVAGGCAVAIRAWYARRLARTSNPLRLVLAEHLGVTMLLLAMLAITGGLLHSPLAPACPLAMAMAGVRFAGARLGVVALITTCGAVGVTLAVDPDALSGGGASLVIWAGTMAGIAVLTTIVAHSERSAHTEAVIDALTGLPNRKGLAAYTDAHDAPDTADAATAVLACDVDHFKEINDRGGHAAGDVALQCIADALRRAAPPGGRVFRLGGDEFLIICRELTVGEATGIAERACQFVRELDGAADIASLSVGVAHRAQGRGALELLMREADEALYRAKLAGRDRAMYPALARVS